MLRFVCRFICRCFGGGQLGAGFGLSPGTLFIRRRLETAHAKFIRAMRIDQFGGADIGAAYQLGQARHSQFQFFRVGVAGHEQTTLCRTPARGLRYQSNFYDGSGGGIGLQMQTQQLQQHLGIAHSHRKSQNFAVNFGLAAGWRICFNNFRVFFEEIAQIKPQMNRRGGQ